MNPDVEDQRRLFPEFGCVQNQHHPQFINHETPLNRILATIEKTIISP